MNVLESFISLKVHCVYCDYGRTIESLPFTQAFIRSFMIYLIEYNLCQINPETLVSERNI